MNHLSFIDMFTMLVIGIAAGLLAVWAVTL
jgi:hypothetical protein